MGLVEAGDNEGMLSPKEKDNFRVWETEVRRQRNDQERQQRKVSEAHQRLIARTCGNRWREVARSRKQSREHQKLESEASRILAEAMPVALQNAALVDDHDVMVNCESVPRYGNTVQVSELLKQMDNDIKSKQNRLDSTEADLEGEVARLDGLEAEWGASGLKHVLNGDEIAQVEVKIEGMKAEIAEKRAVHSRAEWFAELESRREEYKTFGKYLDPEERTRLESDIKQLEVQLEINKTKAEVEELNHEIEHIQSLPTSPKHKRELKRYRKVSQGKVKTLDVKQELSASVMTQGLRIEDNFAELAPAGTRVTCPGRHLVKPRPATQFTSAPCFIWGCEKPIGEGESMHRCKECDWQCCAICWREADA